MKRIMTSLPKEATRIVKEAFDGNKQTDKLFTSIKFKSMRNKKHFKRNFKPFPVDAPTQPKHRNWCLTTPPKTHMI